MLRLCLISPASNPAPIMKTLFFLFLLLALGCRSSKFCDPLPQPKGRYLIVNKLECEQIASFGVHTYTRPCGCVQVLPLADGMPNPLADTATICLPDSLWNAVCPGDYLSR